MSYVQGIDVSAYDPFIVWDKVRARGIRFAIIKATEGTHWSNKYFTQQWSGAKANGILCGAYHYLIAEVDGVRQADHFLSKIELKDGDLPGFLDLEEVGNQNATNSQFIGNAEKWLKRVQEVTGRIPFVYSRASFLNEKLTGQNGKAPPWAKNYPTWIANYFYNGTAGAKPAEAPGWPTWTFWQHTDRGTIDGIYQKATLLDLRPVDLNYYRSSIEDLYKLAKYKQPKPATYTVKAGDTFRSVSDANGLKLDQLLEANPDLIKAGMKLKIPVIEPIEEDELPGEEDVAIREVANIGYSPYTVVAGDTLWAISQKFGLTVEDIVKLNNIANPNSISIGLELRIPKKKNWWNPFG